MDQGESGAIQGMEKRPPQHLGVVAIEKGAFWSPSTKVANFTYFYRRFEFRVFLLLDWFTYQEG